MLARTEAAGPDLIDAVAEFIVAYRAEGHPPQSLREAALTAFAHASGGDYAVALKRADRHCGGC